MSKFYHIRSPNIRKVHLWGTSGCCMGIIGLHTPTKSTLAVIEGSTKFLRPSVHEIWILWLFCTARAICGLFPANRPWPKISYLLFLTLLESYNQFLKRKWIYMEVHTGGNLAAAVKRIPNIYYWQKLTFSKHLRFSLFSKRAFEEMH